jgi:lipid-A-disaccharide synthase
MRIVITAGDPSADVHAARLMAALRQRIPDVVFEGFGGPAMEMQGLRSIAHMPELAVSGFWEVAKRINYFRGLLERATALLEPRRPDLFLPVDYPGFNLRLAKQARDRHIPVAWYIAPQLWAWGENRAEHLARVVDLLMVVFPFEVEFFARHHINATWVGHPMQAHALAPAPQRNANMVVFMPGSRKQELRHHLPLLADVARRLPQAIGHPLEMVVPRAPSIRQGALVSLEQVGVRVVDGAHDAMRSASAGLIKAGTSTLEAAVLGMPFATFYRTSWLTYAIAKRLVNVQSVTMLNLLLKRQVAHEFLQAEATSEALIREVRELLTSEERQRELAAATAEVREVLGITADAPPPADRAADAIVERFVR